MEKQGKMHEDTPWRIQDHNKEWSFVTSWGQAFPRIPYYMGGKRFVQMDFLGQPISKP